MKTRAKLLGLVLGALLAGTKAIAQPVVSLTFDDGLVSHTTAQALLDAHGMKGTFYIISGLIGSDPAYYLGLPAIKAIAADGHEIGGHTVSHPDLTTLTAAQQMHEICDGRAQLIADGFSPYSFAYPYGNSTAVTQSIVGSCYNNGRGAWCNYPNYPTPNDQNQGTCVETIPPPAAGSDVNNNVDWIQTEEAVSNTTTLSDLETYVTNAETAGSGWVVLQFHFICSDTDPTCGNGGGTAEQYGIGVSTFTAFLNWLQAQPVTVEPLGQVMGVFPPSATPIPAITALTPSTMTVTGSSQTLTVTGVNFVAGSSVAWNGSAIPTTYGSATSLTATVPAADLTKVQITTITVVNPGGIVSPGTLLTLVYPVPVLTTLSSTFTVVGSTGITLTVTGSNFLSTSTVRWNGSTRVTTFVSSTTLNAVIPATDLATVKVDSVTVFNPAPGGGTSGILQFTVVNPLPVLTTLSSTFTVVGSSAFTLTLTGSNFVSSSTVRWNGANRVTTFVNATTLTATIPASDLVTVGLNTVTVFNPLPGGGTSSGLSFIVGNPVPVLGSLSTNFVLVGSSGITLTLTGSNFIASSVIQWNGVARPTTFVNSTTLTTPISASELASVTVASLNVFNPGLGGGLSGSLSFTVGNPVPAISALSSTAAIVGSPAFSLTLTGTNFVASSIVQWNGSPRTTTFVNSTTLNAFIPASDLAVTGVGNIAVVSPAPGGGTSNTVTLVVGNPAPGVVSLSPSFIVVGDTAPLSVNVTGLNFVVGSVVLWNGSARTTSFTNSTSLTALIPTSDMAQVGVTTITVANPAPGGGTSNGLSFTVGYPTPTLTRISPSFRTTGTGSFTLTLTGTNFVGNTTVLWNGSPRPTTLVDGQTLTALIPASDVAVSNTAHVTVITSAPGGGTSAEQLLVVDFAQGSGSSIDPLPSLQGLSPTEVLVGGPAFTLSVLGSGFSSDSVVLWNNSARPTTFVSSTQLTIAVSASDVATAGTTTINVYSPTTGGGGGKSESKTFTITSGTLAVRVFPNPWRADLHTNHPVTFDQLPLGSTVKIFTTSGHWVKTLDASSGSATWDLTTDSGKAAASGYYIYLITHSSSDKNRGVLGIIR